MDHPDTDHLAKDLFSAIIIVMMKKTAAITIVLLFDMCSMAQAFKATFIKLKDFQDAKQVVAFTVWPV